MAESPIFPNRKKTVSVPQADPSKQQELLRKVTQPIPPAQKPIPGITGNRPMPTGRILGHELTDIERSTLEAAGWTEDIELPTTQEGRKALQKALEERTAATVPLPVDPTTPPIKVNTVPFASLPADAQERITGSIASFKQQMVDIKAKEDADIKERQEQQKNEARNVSVPGSKSAMQAAEATTAAFKKRMAQITETPVEELPEVVPMNAAAVNAMEIDNRFAQQSAQPQPQPQPQSKSETGAAATLTHCPHCNWDLSLDDIAEPDYADKVSFVQAMAGDIPYIRRYPLFNGMVEVTFRTLTMREIDIVYAQTYADREGGKLGSEVDFWEKINRYRLALQVVSYKSEGKNGFFKELPDGYSASANPHATSLYVPAEEEAKLEQGKTALPTILDWFCSDLIKNETVFRIVYNACNQFNRLVSRMEAMADNTDFWKPTGEQS